MKIGILHGRERSFPDAFMSRVNSKGDGRITAERVVLGGTRTDESIPYRLIVDRMSHEVIYYRSYLKKAVADGVIVVNNPFWWSADDKFFECLLAERLGVAIPRTVVLPPREYPPDVSAESLTNLVEPFPWDEVAAYVGMPAVLKPAIGGGNKNIHIVNSLEELKAAYDTNGQLLMIVQECIEYENYVRCFCVGREHIFVSRYNHRLPRPDRYVFGMEGITPELHDRIVDNCLTLNRALGYDMNTIELAIRDGVPYAIDFLNPAPDFDVDSLKPDRFEWVVEHMANMVIDYATEKKAAPPTLEWQQLLEPQVTLHA